LVWFRTDCGVVVKIVSADISVSRPAASGRVSGDAIVGGNDKEVLHVDAENSPLYDVYDLRYFQSILDEIMGEYGSAPRIPINKNDLETQLAAAIFRSAQKGERDHARLKRSAIEAVSAVPSSDQGS
jgi:hypothetical protein